jgi:hypothetical protein
VEKETYREIRDLYNDADIVSEVKSRRLRWAGHVLRRKEESQLKKVSKNNPEERQPRGRPKQRWWDQVRLDIQRVGATKEDSEDRSIWRGVGVAKYHLRYRWPWE